MTAVDRPDNGHDEGHRNLSEPGNGRCSCGAKAKPGEYIPTWWRRHSQTVTAHDQRRERVARWLAENTSERNGDEWNRLDLPAKADELLELLCGEHSE